MFVFGRSVSVWTCERQEAATSLCTWTLVWSFGPSSETPSCMIVGARRKQNWTHSPLLRDSTLRWGRDLWPLSHSNLLVLTCSAVCFLCRWSSCVTRSSSEWPWTASTSWSTNTEWRSWAGSTRWRWWETSDCSISRSSEPAPSPVCIYRSACCSNNNHAPSNWKPQQCWTLIHIQLYNKHLNFVLEDKRTCLNQVSTDQLFVFYRSPFLPFDKKKI